MCPDFSGANPGTPTTPSITPSELDNQGATDGIQPMSADQILGQTSPPPMTADQILGAGAQSLPQPTPGPTGVLSADQILGAGGGQPGASPAVPNPQPNATPPPPGPNDGKPTLLGSAEDAGASIVKKTMSLLDKASWPIRQHMVSEVAAGAALGIPGAQELYQKLNPDKQLFPDAHYRDVTDFVWDKAATNWDPRTMLPYSNTGAFGRGLLSTAKAITGAAADISHDPLMFTGIGELSEGAKALQAVGDYSDIARATERVPITLRAPFSDGANGVLLSKEGLSDSLNALKSSPPAQAAGKAFDAVASTNLGGKAIGAARAANPIPLVAKVVKYLSPNTGFADVDFAMNSHSALSKGQDAGLIQSYIKNIALKSYSPEEAKLVQELGENLPNLRPNLPEEVINAAKGKISTTEDQLRGIAQAKLQEISEKLRIPVAPGRDQTIIDGLVEAKKSDARYLENQFKAGELRADNVNDHVLENHLPHVMDPAHYGSAQADAAQQYIRKISSQGITRERKMVGTVSEINRMVEEKFGVKNLFIEDPFVATATREAKSQRLVRDTDLLSVVKKYGVTPTPDAVKAGFQPIQHPDVEGLVFPKQIAGKVSYYMGVASPGNLEGGFAQIAQALNRSPVGTQNRILRMQVFTAPGIWARNALDNLGKGIVYGVGSDAWSATHAIMNDAFEGAKSAPNALRPAGKFYSSAELKKIFEDYGASKTTSFREGIDDYMGAAKSSLIQSSGSSPIDYARKAGQFAQGAMNFVSKYGEKAEAFARQAFMYQKIIKEGYEPAAAADAMTRVFFDYTRNSPATDAARFFMPFIQHPIKTALAAPELVGKMPGYYNAIHNTFPAVLANAMSDPMHTEEFNQIAPDYLKSKDAIAGPLLAQNSWLANIFGQSRGGGPVQTYLTPDIGMSILNTMKSPGMNPTLQALLNFVKGKDQYGREIPGDQKWNALFWDTVRGTTSMPNTERYIKQALQLGNPQAYQPLTVHLMRAATSQFMGSIDIDQEAHWKLVSLAHAYTDLQKSATYQLRQETASAMKSPGSFTSYMNAKYGPVIPATNAQIYADAKAKLGQDLNTMKGEEGKTALAQSFAHDKLDAGQYRARLVNLEHQIDAVNKAYQLSATRYLEMARGAKSPAEARARAGVQLFGR